MINYRLVLLILFSFSGTVSWANQISYPAQSWIQLTPSTLNVQGDVGRTVEFKLTLTSLFPVAIPISGPIFSPPLITVTINSTDTTCGSTLAAGASCTLAFDYAPTSTDPATTTITVKDINMGTYTQSTINLTAINPPLQIVDFRTFNASDNDLIQIISAAGGKTTATPESLTINSSDNLLPHQMTSVIACPAESTPGFLQFDISAYSWQGAYSADKPGQPYVNTCTLSFNCNDDKLSVDVPDTTCQALQQYYYDATTNRVYILN